MKRISSLVDRLNLAAGWISKWLIGLITVIMTFDVVMRYAFNRPTVWAFDISYMLGGAFFALGMGYALLKDSHVRVDIFYSKLRPRGRAIVDGVLGLLLFIPTFGLLIAHAIPDVYHSWVISEKSIESFWRPPIYPFKTVFLVSIILLYLQGIVMWIGNIRTILTGEQA